nr:polyketide synthase dehydratase domain-containing protein [Oleomonas cavernae]
MQLGPPTRRPGTAAARRRRPEAAAHPPAGPALRHGMFHGPRLQGVTRIDGYGEQGIVAELVTIPVHDYFSGTSAPRFQLDAAILDAAGQLAGFWLRERNPGVPNCFPFRVKRLSLYAPPPAPGQRYSCHGAITLPSPTVLEARWDVIGADGRLLLRAEGWDDRVFSGDERFFGFRLDRATPACPSRPWPARCRRSCACASSSRCRKARSTRAARSGSACSPTWCWAAPNAHASMPCRSRVRAARSG